MNTNKLPRIALTGKLRSGKSHIASYISARYGFIELSFGDALKRVANELFEGSDVYKFEPITRECPFSEDGYETIGYHKPRKLYQDVGQSLRALDEDVWIRQLEKSMYIWEDMRSTKGIIIDDLRQPNEYEWARRNGFVIIRVNANEDTRLERARAAGDDFSLEDLRHDTEMHVDDYEVDYEIWNDDGVSLTELERNIDVIMSDIKATGGR